MKLPVFCVVCGQVIASTGSSIPEGPCHIECFHRYVQQAEPPISTETLAPIPLKHNKWKGKLVVAVIAVIFVWYIHAFLQVVKASNRYLQEHPQTQSQKTYTQETP